MKKRSKLCIEQIDENTHMIILKIPNEALPQHIQDNIKKDIVYQKDLSLTVGVNIISLEDWEWDFETTSLLKTLNVVKCMRSKIDD